MPSFGVRLHSFAALRVFATDSDPSDRRGKSLIVMPEMVTMPAAATEQRLSQSCRHTGSADPVEIPYRMRLAESGGAQLTDADR